MSEVYRRDLISIILPGHVELRFLKRRLIPKHYCVGCLHAPSSIGCRRPLIATIRGSGSYDEVPTYSRYTAITGQGPNPVSCTARYRSALNISPETRKPHNLILLATNQDFNPREPMYMSKLLGKGS